MTSAHAGFALEPVEAMIVQGPRSDFFSRVILGCQNDTMSTQYELSADKSSITGTGKAWPTDHIYSWICIKSEYERTTIELQIASPFDGFMTLTK